MLKLSFVTVEYDVPNNYLIDWFDNITSLRHYLPQFELDYVIVNTGEFKCNLDPVFGNLGLNYQYFEVPENLGYCGGNNFGIEKAKGDFIIILNPDLYIYNSLVIDWLYSASAQNNQAITGCYRDGLTWLTYPAMFPTDQQYDPENLPFCYNVNPLKDPKLKILNWKSLPFIDGAIMGFFRETWEVNKFDEKIFPGYFGENTFQYEAQRNLGTKLIDVPITKYIEHRTNSNVVYSIKQKMQWAEEARAYFYERYALDDYNYFLSQLV